MSIALHRIVSSALCLALALTLAAPVAAKEPPRPPAVMKLGPRDHEIARGAGGISGATFSPDGTLIALGGAGKVVRLWDVKAGKEQRLLEGHPGFIRTLAFSPDGTLLTAAGDDASGGAALWDVATGKLVRHIGKHQHGLRQAVFSPDGHSLLTSGFDEHIGLWEVATGKRLLYFRAHPRVPYGIAFSPDGKLLASGGDNEGTIRLWDAATGKQRRSWHGHPGSVYSVAFSPDGRLLASGGADTAARLWEVASGKEVRSLPGHDGGVSKVTFAPDRRTLATASYNRTAHIWEVASGQEVRRFGQHNGWVWGVAFAPNGRSLVSTGSDGIAVLWNLGPTAAAQRASAAPLTDTACDAAWRDLLGADAGRAFTAALTLSASDPKRVVPFLRERLHPAPAQKFDTERLRRLVRDLDSADFSVRGRAARELAAAGESALPALRAGLADPPSLEARRRLEALVTKAETRDLPPETLRGLRALRVLEEAGTDAARALLTALAGGAAGDPLTREAAVVLRRMPRRRSP